MRRKPKCGRQTDGQGDSSIPPYFVAGGIKRLKFQDFYICANILYADADADTDADAAGKAIALLH